jgi:D-alanyl-D-alanine dipeptidase
MKIFVNRVKEYATIYQNSFLLTITCSFLLIYSSFSQTSIIVPKKVNGLQVVDNKELFLKTVQADSNKRMVSLKSLIPSAGMELRYATNDNFMHKKMYNRKTKATYLRLPAAKALLQVQQELNAKGYGIKIFDAYRPYSVTEKFWELVHDERYVADPKKGSGHNRGIAVDLTIIDLTTKKELDMGTGFDNFTDSAHQDFSALPETVLANRKLLKETMEKYGFKLFETEWWHYSWPNPEKYEILDLDIAKGNKYFK